MHDRIREKSIILENRLKAKLSCRMPEYIFSNDLFENWIKELLRPETIWIDAGCGNNSLVYEFEHLSPKGKGIDRVEHPNLKKDDKKFISADLENIPLESSSIDLIVSNMVTEHINNIGPVLKEFHRILKKGGSYIFRTSNKWYPTLFFGNLFPKKTKDWIIYKIFGVESHDIFETTYPINTLKKINRVLPEFGFGISRIEAVEDLHMFNPMVFEISCNLYKFQRLNMFKWLRNCIVCQAVKQ